MRSQRNILLILVLGLWIAFSLSNADSAKRGNPSEIPYSQFLAESERGRVDSVTIQGQQVFGSYSDGTTFQTFAPSGADVTEPLEQKGITFGARPEPKPSFLANLVIGMAPILLLVGLWVYFMRRMQGGQAGGAFGFGKSKARQIEPDKHQTTFQDVAGVDEAKQDLEEIVTFLKSPSQFTELGGRIPRGLLLVGPPGTGKTLLARAVAGEAKVPFFSISGSDFVEMFVGVGASRVRDMFEKAKSSAPCIIFIDEIDAVGRSRGVGIGGGHDEREQTLNQLLVEMDGFESNEGVIVIAATNRADVLDQALLRPGRFDRQVTVPNPDLVGREQILDVHAKKVPLSGDVDLRTVARGTPGFSGADLANLVNEAALTAARAARRLVTMEDFETAKDKLLIGAERRTMIMSEDERKLTAYHEAGHALVGLRIPGNDPLHKVTIIPRGRALGVTVNLPERDRYSMRKSEIEGKLAMMFGGRVAEELIFGASEVTTGASNDIERATELARRMVTEWGMSDVLGSLRYSQQDDQPFAYGGTYGRTQPISDETAALIDSEVRRIIDESEMRAQLAIESHMDELHLIAQGLLEHETLSAQDIQDLLAGKQLGQPTEGAPDEPKVKPSSVPNIGSAALSGATAGK